MPLGRAFFTTWTAFALCVGCSNPRRHERAGDWQSEAELDPRLMPARTILHEEQPHSDELPIDEPRRASFGEKWIAMERWCASNHLAAPQRQAGPSGAYWLEGPDGRLEVRPGKLEAAWNGS